MTTWAAVLGVFLAVFAFYETRGIGDGKPNTTLSAFVWRYRQLVVVRLIGGAALGWSLWHLFSPWDTYTGGWDDVLAIATGIGLGAFTQYRPRDGA